MILDPDYARVFTQARIVAWQYGYACVAHGSYTRDLDILLVPWTDAAKPNYDQLVRLIADAGGLRFRTGDDIHTAPVDWSDKPHGRRAVSLFFPDPSDRRWVDISVVQLPMQIEQPAAQDEPSAAFAWHQGYRAGINDERTSEANIGIAGFGAKVEPNRQNPYAHITRQQPASKPMTDEQARGLAESFSWGTDDIAGTEGRIHVIREVERFHKIKE